MLAQFFLRHGVYGFPLVINSDLSFNLQRFRDRQLQVRKLQLRVKPFEFRCQSYLTKTSLLRLTIKGDLVSLAGTVLIQYQCVTDFLTDRYMDINTRIKSKIKSNTFISHN